MIFLEYALYIEFCTKQIGPFSESAGIPISVDGPCFIYFFFIFLLLSVIHLLCWRRIPHTVRNNQLQVL